MTMFIAAQVLGIVVTLLIPFVYLCRHKTTFYTLHIILNILKVVQFIFLGAWTGCIGAGVSTVKNTVYYIFSRKNKMAPAKYMLFFMCVSVTLCSLAVTDLLSALPVVCIVLTCVCNWQHNYLIMCCGNAVSTLLNAIYSYTVGAYSNIPAYIVELAAIIVGLVRHRKFNNKES